MADLVRTVFSLLLCYQATSGPQSLLSPKETRRLMRWPDKECYLRPLPFLVVSLLLSLVSTLIFSWIGGILSHRNSLTCRFLFFPLRNLWFLVMLTMFSLSYTATDTVYYSAFISSGLRILPAALVDTSPRAALISFCTVQKRTLCTTHSLATPCLFTTSGPCLGQLPGFWCSMASAAHPSFARGQVTTTKTRRDQMQGAI